VVEEHDNQGKRRTPSSRKTGPRKERWEVGLGQMMRSGQEDREARKRRGLVRDGEVSLLF
jgi:hypothetical protein